MKHLFFILIFIEIILSVLLGIKVFRKSNILGITSTNIIRKNDIVFNNKGKFKYFYEPKPNLKQIEKPDWLGQTVINTINSDGLNERYDYSIDKPQGIYRIVTLGDSFTFGAHVSTENNWVELLENRLNQKSVCRDINKFEVINLGVPGYDIQYSLERYKQRGKKYNPDLVLWFLKNDDFYDIAEETQPIVNIQKEKLKKKRLYEGTYNEKDIATLAQMTYDAIGTINNKYGKKEIMVFQGNLLEEFAKIHQGRTFFFSMNEKAKTQLATTGDEDDTIQKVINKHRGYFYSNKLFSQYNEAQDSYYPYDSHFNEKGHALVAEELYDYLIKENIIACKQGEKR